MTGTEFQLVPWYCLRKQCENIVVFLFQRTAYIWGSSIAFIHFAQQMLTMHCVLWSAAQEARHWHNCLHLPGAVVCQELRMIAHLIWTPSKNKAPHVLKQRDVTWGYIEKGPGKISWKMNWIPIKKNVEGGALRGPGWWMEFKIKSEISLVWSTCNSEQLPVRFKKLRATSVMDYQLLKTILMIKREVHKTNT